LVSLLSGCKNLEELSHMVRMVGEEHEEHELKEKQTTGPWGEVLSAASHIKKFRKDEEHSRQAANDTSTSEKVTKNTCAT